MEVSVKRVKVTLYSKEKCPLCDKGREMLEEIQRELSYELEVIDIYEDDELLEKYQLMIPVVCIGNEEIDFGQLSRHKIKTAIENKNF